MELHRGGVGSQAAGRRMDGDCRDGGSGSRDAGSEDYENLPTSASVSTHMTAGAMAGILEHSLMYPLDSVKTRMQSLHPDPRAQYTSIYGALKKIIQTEGFWRPLRGLNVMMTGAGPAHAMYFACYENMKRTLNDVFSHQGNSHLANGIAGSMATLLHDAVMNPAEVVKQRLQMYNSQHRSALSCIRTVWRTEGLGAFYRSYTTQLTMNIPFQSIHFITYEFLQEQVNPLRNYNPQSHIISGGLAGALAAAATTPLDVCKTLLNTQENMALSLANVNGRLSGMANAFRMVYQLNGFTGYFKGLYARVIYQMPSTAISWSVYEFFKYFLTKRQLENRTLY
ncbi:mitoferrin-1 isoform X2 [Microtus ochrogaster]|uniref:Mitoferrin-1 n=1 Tax=Microtus ochrogaster TaxID=79684 RepID=A0ABM0KYT4_MICOH|nr:mitoferrin-1 isoform X2 [Microtus ochrogaster]